MIPHPQAVERGSIGTSYRVPTAVAYDLFALRWKSSFFSVHKLVHETTKGVYKLLVVVCLTHSEQDGVDEFMVEGSLPCLIAKVAANLDNVAL